MSSNDLPVHITRLVARTWLVENALMERWLYFRLYWSLHGNPLLIERFCRHYLLHYEDEDDGGLYVALRVLRRLVDELDLPVAHVLTRAACSSKMIINYKHSVVFILSKMENRVPVPTYRKIMRQAGDDLKISLANDILVHIHLVMCLEKAFALISLCLRLSTHRSKRIRSSLLSPFFLFDKRYSERRTIIYEYCLNKLEKPHHKVLLYIGLTVASPKRAADYSDSASIWAKDSALVRWYLREYERGRE